MNKMVFQVLDGQFDVVVGILYYDRGPSQRLDFRRMQYPFIPHSGSPILSLNDKSNDHLIIN
jgi:hypothetical protein